MAEKIAHLFLIRNNLNREPLWLRFFAESDGLSNIYAHAKWPRETTSPLLLKRLITAHCETRWGQVSLVEAELLLLEAALQDKENQFFLLHSESCVPLRSYAFVYREITRYRRSWLGYFRGAMERYRWVNQSVINKSDFYIASQFFCLTRSHATLVATRERLVSWRQSKCPDEHYIPTTLSQAHLLEECLCRDVTFSDWNRAGMKPAHPVTFERMTANDLDTLRKTTSLFARKFTRNSDIDNYLPFIAPWTSACFPFPFETSNANV